MLSGNITSPIEHIKTWLSHQIFSQKLNNPLGYILLTTLGLAMGALVALLGFKGGAVLIGIVVILPVVVASMFYHQFGIAFTLIIAFLVQVLGKYTNAPIGTSLDGMLILMIFGILVGQIIKKDWSFAKDPISTLILIWIYYNIFQVLNPAMQSKMAWLYTVRSLAILNLLYFIACYAFSNFKKIQWMLNFMIGLAFFTALYGIKQEKIGFSETERAWIYSDPERFQLFFQWGRMRIFSLFNDAMTFGIMMAYMGVYCFIYATAPIKKHWRAALLFMSVVMFWASAYSGTRTCYVLIPIGFVFYAAMTLSKQVMIGAGIFIVLGAGVMMKSTSNPVLFRIQSSFKPSEDASVQIRYYNQKRIRPYIYNYPIGHGPGSTGLWARRFTPETFLANFAHDSYYVRLAVEEGWIGLLLYMSFFFVLMQRGLYFYLRVRDPMIKNQYLCVLTALFMLAVSNYPQESIVQLPTSLVSYIFFAAIVKMKDYDSHFQEINKSIVAA